MKWYPETTRCLQNFAVSICAAQLEEGSISVDPASGLVTNVTSDGGSFASFQEHTRSDSRGHDSEQRMLTSILEGPT